VFSWLACALQSIGVGPKIGLNFVGSLTLQSIGRQVVQSLLGLTHAAATWKRNEQTILTSEGSWFDE
jgi:hypothetical protein